MKRFLAALALLVIGACAAQAEPARAQPEAAATVQGTHPALFVVRDADSTMYLFGTVHVRPRGEPWGGPEAQAALASADEIWTEMEISSASEARLGELVRERGYAPADKPLSAWLSADENERLARTAQRLAIPSAMLEEMKPWLAAVTITYIAGMQGGFDAMSGVDRAVDVFGDTNGKRMRYFETPEQQMGFFADLTADQQRQLLLDTLDETDQGVELMNRVDVAWRTGDLETLNQLVVEDMRTEFPALYRVLLKQRNDAWVQVLTHEMEGAGVDFVAVGTAHLLGDDGLVAQLRARGLSVERVPARN